MTKVCSVCGVEKASSEFYSNCRGGIRPSCKPCYREYQNAARKALDEETRALRRIAHNARIRERYRELRQVVLEAYGAECQCCHEDDEVFLAVDHVNNDGHVERKKFKNHTDFYLSIIARGFPSDYQILCHNCNWAKRFGECPHVRSKSYEAS